MEWIEVIVLDPGLSFSFPSNVYVLFYEKEKGIVIAKWDNKRNIWRFSDFHSAAFGCFNPTHWMPLPMEPPNE